MSVYLDTSTLVKRYLLEPGTDAVRDLLRSDSEHSISIIGRVEVVAAIGRAIRQRDVAAEVALSAVRLFEAHWPDYISIPATEQLMVDAASFAWVHGLKGYDAVHLASATRVPAPMVFATFDLALWAAARAEGLDAWPPDLGG